MWNKIKDFFLGKKVKKVTDLVVATAIVYDQSDNRYVFTRSGKVLNLAFGYLSRGDKLLNKYLEDNSLWIDDYGKYVVRSYVKSVEVMKTQKIVTIEYRM